MSSLYRCKVRVAYKPYDLDELIVFEERQVAEAEVNLKWESGPVPSNAEGLGAIPGFVGALSSSTCRAVINDPYMTGIAWPLLYDAASLYTNSDNAAKHGLMLPQCGEGQDPRKDKCRKLPDLDNTGQPFLSGIVDRYPHLLISMWYDVKGTRFGTDFFFRVVNMNITHGSSYPTVQILGQETRSIVFNQNLVNYGFEEGTTFEKAIEKVVKDYGYEPSFCATDYTKSQLVQPNSTRESGLTPYEVIKRRLNAAGGNMLTMPTREWQDKISICTRAGIDQACKVFYLGKGLYQNYTLDGVPNSQFAANLERSPGGGANINNNLIYTTPTFEADEYNLSDTLFKNLRAAKLKDVKKNKFTDQFKEIDKRFDSNQATSGLYWEGTGPKVKDKSANNLNMFGISPNGENSIAYLDGLVRVADKQTGRVLILTKYFIYACGKQKGTNSSKCFSRPIYQEVTNLTEVSISKSAQLDEKTYVTMGQTIGKSTKEKPDFVRFWISAHKGQTTIPAEIVYKYAIPEDGLTDEEISKYIGQRSVSNSPASVGSPGASPKSNRGKITPTTTRNAPKILIMAGHYDVQKSLPGAEGEEYKANKYALDWIRENASKYGISNVLEFYVPGSPQIDNPESVDSQWSRGRAAVAQGKQVIEIHHDAYRDQKTGYEGSSGVIPPIPGKVIYPLDEKLSQVYGSFGTNWRRDGGDLGIPKRGGTILEIATFSPENKARALSPNKATRDAYYKQVLEPFMRTVYNQYVGSGSTSTPAPVTTSSNGSPLTVGLVGSTGRSTGPHLHAQWAGRAPITTADVDKYVRLGGKKPSEGDVGDLYLGRGGTHFGIDYPRPKGTPVSIINGASYVDKAYEEKGCGNYVIIKVPDGREMLLCHLMDGSIPPTLKPGQSSGSSGSTSGTNRFNSGMPTGPVAQGLHVSTTFKGIPRALRIIPGRTILSFVTDYDNWIEQGKPRNIDPGVWIPQRFSKFFIKECSLKWRGDLKVDIRGVTDWGITTIKSPSFNDYLKEIQKDSASVTKDYFGYIRSVGDLCYKYDGKDSCDTLCSEVQAIESFLNSNREEAKNLPETTTNFGPSNCRYNGTTYPADVANKILGALQSAGITSKVAVAGVLGNVAQESTFDPFVHVNRPGAGCDGSPGYGLFQWCFSRQTQIKDNKRCGKGKGTLQCQLAFMLEELNGEFKSAVTAVNNSSTPEQAAIAWNNEYEKGDLNNRPKFARDIFNDLKCNKP